MSRQPEPANAAAPKPPWHRSPWLWAFVIGAVGTTLLRPYCAKRTRKVPKPPPVIGHVPTFELTNQAGETFGTKDLEGEVYVANFIFTRCRATCPRMTAQMKKLQTRYEKANVPIALVSFSVDPKNDSPEKLREYGKRYGADFGRWTFLTGKEAKIRRLLEKGFRVVMGKKERIKNMIDIAHTTRFVIVDREGGIRGHYPSDDEGIDEIFHRSQHVLKAKK
jgi:protein SCO1/2